MNKTEIIPVESIKPNPSQELAIPRPVDADPIPAPMKSIPTSELPKLELPKIEFQKPELKFEPKQELPKIELPGLDIPGATPLAIPKSIEPSVSKSSPLNAEVKGIKVDQFPVDGKIPSDPNTKRSVTFYNFSGRDLLLTIDGKMVMLTNKYCVSTELASEFQWQMGAETERTVKVPVTSPGIEIVIK